MAQLPRAVSTQALSSAGLLRMVNKAADAVNKMTIKMNESDAVSKGGRMAMRAGGARDLKGAGKEESEERMQIMDFNQKT